MYLPYTTQQAACT
uniref:Uncharacterized protein n=1 Tax=Anopheles arabiensis TaxID=7173 RepID=A0A182HXX8_ANOAR